MVNADDDDEEEEEEEEEDSIMEEKHSLEEATLKGFKEIGIN
jgi:hypothetical protein